jgi:prolyl oligopeptidase
MPRQRFPSRDHGSVNDDIAGTETEKDLNAMLYYHQIGTTQADDILVMKDPQNPTYMWSMGVSEKDGRFLALTVRKDTSRVGRYHTSSSELMLTSLQKNKIWLCDLTKSAIGPDMPWVKVVDEFKASYGLCGPLYWLPHHLIFD